MHSIMSKNQLAGWNSHTDSLLFNEQDTKIDDYIECLIECADDESSCQRICKEILV